MTANATTKPIEVALEPGVEITGRVTRGGSGVEGINVAVMAMDNSELSSTGPDGRFTVSDLTPGPYMVIFNKQDEFIQQMRNITAPARDVSIDLPPGGRVSGRVLDKSTHQPVTSFNAGVSTARMGGGMQIDVPPMMKSFTSDDGSFTLDNVPTGRCRWSPRRPATRPRGSRTSRWKRERTPTTSSSISRPASVSAAT